MRWRELVAGISKPTVSLVLGGGHSIGIRWRFRRIILLWRSLQRDDPASDPHQRTLITAEPTFAYMIKTQERVVDFIVEHSHASRADIEAK